jgi:hypothetical protein
MSSSFPRSWSPALVLLAACGGAAPPVVVPALEAERSQLSRTGDYAEAVAMCEALAARYPDQARCERFGVSPEGRALVALIASADGVLTPERAAAAGRPVVFIEGGIHAGEIEGKDAGFLVLRDALAGTGPAAPGLRAATVVFVPIFNVDGHERRGPNNRPNQRGPEEMGFRTNAGNLNLNRDWLKADAPETVLLLGLLGRWDPALFIDLHATDGAKFEHDIAVMLAPVASRGDGLAEVAAGLSTSLQADLTALGHLPLPFYPSFVTDDDPTSGFAIGEAPPRFSTGYTTARDRLGILVETHSWRTYPERVASTRHLLEAVLARAPKEAAGWRAAAEAADRAGSALAGTQVALAFAPGGEPRTIDFRGYAYERKPSEISGGTWIVYDEAKPEVWRIPLREKVEPALVVTAPRGGYLIAAGFAADVARRLDAHGIVYRRLTAARSGVAVETFRADEVTFDKPFEGRTRATLKGAWKPERQDLAAGSLFVPIAQPRARLVLHLLEPLAPDSLAGWGFFNGVFERKEYMEAYVAEAEARRMLEADPALRKEFEAKLAADAAFKASPGARLDFFYRRHPAFDQRWNLLPVYRSDVDVSDGVTERTAGQPAPSPPGPSAP